jgi:hypothetical protein
VELPIQGCDNWLVLFNMLSMVFLELLNRVVALGLLLFPATRPSCFWTALENIASAIEEQERLCRTSELLVIWLSHRRESAFQEFPHGVDMVEKDAVMRRRPVSMQPKSGRTLQELQCVHYAVDIRGWEKVFLDRTRLFVGRGCTKKGYAPKWRTLQPHPLKFSITPPRDNMLKLLWKTP